MTDDGSRYRGLLTDTDRAHISGESDPSDTQRKQAVYRARKRIREELPRDMALLAEHEPALIDDLRRVACEEGDR